MEQKNLITEVDILDESKECFLTYASEVLTDRAIPAAEDGLLSSQRKILWTMEDHLKMDSKGKTKKCNGIVGSTLSTSYYHGDSSCYGVLCKMSQKYLMRYPLVEGQGSLGTQEDNDLVASSRYTEAKPSVYTDLMMLDYKKNPVPTKETYNGEYMEPVVLPAFFPNALCNGRQAIGISMAHNSSPHNLSEVCDAIQAYIDNPAITIDDIMNHIQGPDFPLGGTIINKKDIKAALATGKSNISLKVRGDYEIENDKIIFTTIPYRAYRNKIKEQLENNVEEFENVLEDFNDESNLGANRLIFVSKPGQTQVLLNKLFKFTDLQTSISYNMNFIVNGTPKLCSIIDLLKSYVEHQNNIMVKIANNDLSKAEKRAHIVEGMIIAVKDIDRAIFMIKNSENKEDARKQLINYFKITEEQANAILDMKLSRITRLDRDELLKELEELQKAIVHYNKIIKDEQYRNNTLKEKVAELKSKYGDARRTKIIQMADPLKEDKEIEFVEPEKCVVVMTEGGLIKRIPVSTFKTQKKNGKGVKTQDDITQAIIRTNTIDHLMIFTDKGMMYKLLVNDVPIGTNASKGTPINSLIKMIPNEKPKIIYSIYRDTDAEYVFFITKKGLVKKTPLKDYSSMKSKTGVAAIKLRAGDDLASVFLIKNEEVILISEKGMGIRFSSQEVSSTSRMTEGVIGMKVDADDVVACGTVIRDLKDDVAIFGPNGLGKRISLNDFPRQKRGGKGACYQKTEGGVKEVVLVSDEDTILISGNKKNICVSVKDIPRSGKKSTGFSLIKDNKIISVSKV